MKLSPIARKLYDRISELPVVDAHQHLPPEKEYIAFEYRGLNMLANYIHHDLLSAGLSRDFYNNIRLGGKNDPVEKWWPVIKPFWENCKNTTYSKALRITARDLWDLDDINDDTIHEFSEKVMADNTPGLYRRILQDKCNIRFSLCCSRHTHFPDDPGLRAVVGILPWVERKPPIHFNCLNFDDWGKGVGKEIKTLDEAVWACQSLVRKNIENGAIGLKLMITDILEVEVAASVAEREAQKAFATKDEKADFPLLRSYFYERCFDVAAEMNVPVAVHTGYWDDFRKLDPKLLLGFARRREDVRFDMFHLGMPMVRDAAVIGKTLPNVTLNLTWCPIISQIQTARMLDEIIDLVPINKVIAFGGDYASAVQNTYGHLVLMREAVAYALANRVETGDFDLDYAIRIAKMWFHDNPGRIYNV